MGYIYVLLLLPEKLYPILRSPDTWNAVGAGLGCWHGTKIWQNFGADMNDNRMIMAIESAQHQATNSIFVAFLMEQQFYNFHVR